LEDSELGPESKVSRIGGDMIVLLRLVKSAERGRQGCADQMYVSGRVIEVDRGEVDVRHRDVGLGYNWQD
jgi:hypothetical protein